MSAYSAAVLADSPKGYWRMDMASGAAIDASGNGHDSAVPSGGGTITYSEPGAIASDPASTSVKIDTTGGSNWFEVPDHADVDLGDGPLSLELWVKPNDNGSTRVLLTKESAAYEIRLTSNNKIALTKAATVVFDESTQTIVTGTGFHHVVITKNAAAPKYYIDGVDVTPGGMADFTLTDNSNTLNLGGGGAANFNGWVDEIAVYKSVLSAARVQDHYIAGVARSLRSQHLDYDYSRS